MTLAEWLSDSRRRIRRNGIKEGVQDSWYEFYLGLLRRMEPFASPGRNVFEEDWDLLILLDSARVDAVKEVASEYDFLDRPGKLRSVGSASYEWMDQTFTDEYSEEMRQTLHVTSNHFSQEFLSDDDFYYLDEVWRRGWDENSNTIPARPVTNAAIWAGREFKGQFDRCIVHYMQPHLPSVPDPVVAADAAEDTDTDLQRLVWDNVRKGRLEKSRLWESYLENLRYVLDDVECLLENFDAETVRISADHANAFGEWGVYGHPNVPLSCLRTVPWYETTATDSFGYSPEKPDVEQYVVENIDERLRALGYK